MGVVYEGYDPLIGKRVAIKVLKAEGDARAADLLLAEAKLVNAVEHRGVVQIFSGGKTDDGGAYVVMEYLSGVSLQAHLEAHGALPLQDALQILDEVAAALGAAHHAQVIHRDLKPSNIFLVVQPDGSTFAKVLDFGLAKVSSWSDGKVDQTSVTHVRGTPHYMAPEQLRGLRVGPVTDLYALGVVAYELLTGRHPFEDLALPELLKAHVGLAPEPPSTHVPGVPLDVDRLVLALLEKDEARRPQTAEEVRAQLKFIRAEARFAASSRLLLPPDGAAGALAPPARPRLTAAPAPSTHPVAPFAPDPSAPAEVAPVITSELEAPPTRRSRRRFVLGVAAALLAAVAVWAWAMLEPAPSPQAPEPLPPLSEVSPIPVAPPPPSTPEPAPTTDRKAVPSRAEPVAPERAAAAKPQRRRTLNLGPGVSKRSPLLQRLERVRAAWAAQKRSMPKSQTKPYDDALDYCEDQLQREEQAEATRCVDEFVRLVLQGREP